MNTRCIRGATLPSALLAAQFLLGPVAANEPTGGNDILDTIERRIAKEPKYVATPRYALMVFGTRADSQVWMVEDGSTLYVDRNANGDLTDDGPPLRPLDERVLSTLDSASPRWDFDYVFDKITPARGSPHTEFRLRRWNYGYEEDHYGLSVTVAGRTPMYAGWFGTFWAASPAEVPIIHFGGPLRPRMLRFKEKAFVVGPGFRRLSLAFVNPGGGEGALSRLSIDALPPTTIPVLTIDWPVAAGAPPVRKSYPLVERCCYWEFYELDFKVPSSAVPGTATVTVSFDGGTLPFNLTNRHHQSAGARR